MPDTSRTWLTRLMAFGTMLCMVAVVMSGFASAQARVHGFEHQANGDELLADGGWVATCVDANGECTGHVSEPPAPDNDPLPMHHHHHSSGEASPGVIPNEGGAVHKLTAAIIALHPGVSTPLADRTPSVPHQPPRG